MLQNEDIIVSSCFFLTFSSSIKDAGRIKRAWKLVPCSFYTVSQLCSLELNEPLPPTRCLEVGDFSVNMLNTCGAS
jgi:hypothetical protein